MARKGVRWEVESKDWCDIKVGYYRSYLLVLLIDAL
jgi:hypothetical protein